MLCGSYSWMYSLSNASSDSIVKPTEICCQQPDIEHSNSRQCLHHAADCHAICRNIVVLHHTHYLLVATVVVQFASTKRIQLLLRRLTANVTNYQLGATPSTQGRDSRFASILTTALSLHITWPTTDPDRLTLNRNQRLPTGQFSEQVVNSNYS